MLRVTIFVSVVLFFVATAYAQGDWSLKSSYFKIY